MKRPGGGRERAARHLQLTREWRLLRELEKNPEGRSYVELAASLGTAVRTVYRDIETLKRAGFAVVRGKVHGKAVWRLEGSGGPAVRFTAQELTALAMARNMLLSSPGSPFQRAMQQAYHKIQAASDRDGIKVLEMADRRLYADLRRARPYTEREVWFRMLLDAVTRQRTVRIRYFTLERGSEDSREVEPYGMVLHEGAFYLVARCRWRNDIRTFLVDRVHYVAETGAVFSVPQGFSVREHFRQAWGLLKGRALVSVRVRFDRSVARVIREGRWHESQRIEDAAAGAVVMTVKVAGWEEVKRWILGFGAAAEVLEPPDLREAVAREAAGLVRAYSGAGGDRAPSGAGEVRPESRKRRRQGGSRARRR